MLELTVAVLLIILNGVFALSELAIVSARKARLAAMAEARHRGAGIALGLAENPGRFLSTVQIGITLVGILAGAFSGAALSANLEASLVARGVPQHFAEPIAYTLVIGAITYLSVIIGELVPKQLALRNPEAIACIVAPPMAFLSRAAGPVIWLLDSSSRFVFGLLGLREHPDSAVTEQDIKAIVAEAESAGIIETHERTMISGVLRLGDRRVTSVMTPRPDVEWLDLNLPDSVLYERLLTSKHSRLPVAEGSPDEMIGVLQVADIARAGTQTRTPSIRELVRTVPVVPDSNDALEVLEVLRKSEVPMALVHDEYGHFLGVVTPADILDAIAGAFSADEPEDEPVQRADGSWLIEGTMPADEMADLLRITLPEGGHFNTVAGFVINEFQRLPNVGDSVTALGWTFEVVDLDGRRVDKVLATKADG